MMNKQLSVATNTSKILTCLKNHPEGITPKLIALSTRINHNTVKSLLPKIKGVKKILRGLYKVVEGGDTPIISPIQELHSWNFHNCILSCQLTNHPKKTITTTYSFNIINYEFVISNSGHASMRISSDNPLNISSICSCYAYFSELLSKHSSDSITQKKCYISTIEFNKDYKNLRLEGVKCLTVDNLVEQFKLYQKKACMRIEHKTKVKLTVENVVDMLTNNPNSLETNIKLSKVMEQNKALIEKTATNTELIFKLIDKMKGNNGD